MDVAILKKEKYQHGVQKGLKRYDPCEDSGDDYGLHLDDNEDSPIKTSSFSVIDQDQLVTFHNVTSNERLKYRVSEDKNDIPKLGKKSGRLISNVYHLLPHSFTFPSPIKVTIKFEQRPQNGRNNIVVFYSSTAPTERPHWEMITEDNKSDPERRIVQADESSCTITMSTLCAICVANLYPEQLSRCMESKFDLYVGMAFEAENMSDGNNETWLVKVKVYFSLNGSKSNDVSEWQKLEVVKNPPDEARAIFHDVNIHVFNVKPEWSLDIPGKDSDDISIFQLKNGIRKKVLFSYYRDSAKGNHTFSAEVRVHQTNMRNDCFCVLEDSGIIGKMISRPTWQNSASDACQRQLSTDTTNSQLDLTPASTTRSVQTENPGSNCAANIPYFVDAMHSSSTVALETKYNDLMQEISTAIECHPIEDGVLKLLCDRLKCGIDLDRILQSVEQTCDPPSMLALKEWKRKTGGDLEILQDIHAKYVNGNNKQT